MLPEWIDWRCIQTHTNTLTHTHLVAKLLYLRCGCTARIEIFCLPALLGEMEFHSTSVEYFIDATSKRSTNGKRSFLLLTPGRRDAEEFTRLHAHTHTHTQPHSIRVQGHICTYATERNVLATGAWTPSSARRPEYNPLRCCSSFSYRLFSITMQILLHVPLSPLLAPGSCETMGTEPTYFPIEATLSFAFSCDTGHKIRLGCAHFFFCLALVLEDVSRPVSVLFFVLHFLKEQFFSSKYSAYVSWRGVSAVWIISSVPTNRH